MTNDQALILIAQTIQSLTARVAALEQAGPATVPAEVAQALAALGASNDADEAGTVAVPGID